MPARQETLNKPNLISHFSDQVYSSMTMFARRVFKARQPIERKVRTRFDSPLPCADRTGVSCVLHIICNSENGIHPTALALTTGYDRTKLEKILHELFQEGEIMIQPGGVYTGKIPGL